MGISAAAFAMGLMALSHRNLRCSLPDVVHAMMVWESPLLEFRCVPWHEGMGIFAGAVRLWQMACA